MLPTITIPIAIITIGIIILAPLKFSTFDMKALGDVFNNLKDIPRSFSQRRRRRSRAVRETGGGVRLPRLERLQRGVSEIKKAALRLKYGPCKAIDQG
jgi:hypothetical protein